MYRTPTTSGTNDESSDGGDVSDGGGGGGEEKKVLTGTTMKQMPFDSKESNGWANHQVDEMIVRGVGYLDSNNNDTNARYRRKRR